MAPSKFNCPADVVMALYYQAAAGHWRLVPGCRVQVAGSGTRIGIILTYGFWY